MVSFNYHNSPTRQAFITPILLRRNEGSKRLSDLLKAMGLVRGRVGPWMQMCLIPEQMLCPWISVLCSLWSEAEVAWLCHPVPVPVPSQGLPSILSPGPCPGSSPSPSLWSSLGTQIPLLVGSCLFLFIGLLCDTKLRACPIPQLLKGLYPWQGAQPWVGWEQTEWSSSFHKEWTPLAPWWDTSAPSFSPSLPTHTIHPGNLKLALASVTWANY